MNDTTWLRQIPYGGYQDGRGTQYLYQPMQSYARPHPAAPPHWPPPYTRGHGIPGYYVGQNPYADPNRPPGYGPDQGEMMRPLGTTLLLAAVSFALFGGIGAALGFLVHPSTKGAAVGAYLGLAALQASSAIRRNS